MTLCGRNWDDSSTGVFRKDTWYCCGSASGRQSEDGDGVTTNAEVEANWRQHPRRSPTTWRRCSTLKGGWTAEALEQVRTVQGALYRQARTAALAMDDDAPYPDAATPMAKASWWKSWFTDETTIASAPMSQRYTRP